MGLVLLVTACGGGGDEGDAAAVPPPGATSTTTAGAGVAEARTEVPLAPLPAVGRDPFVPIVTVPKEAGVGAGQPASQAPTASRGTAPSPGAAPTPAPAGAGSASLELKSVSRGPGGVPRANITVDGRSYNPATGESFSYGYRLERIDGNCVEVSAQTARARMCLPAPAP